MRLHVGRVLLIPIIWDKSYKPHVERGEARCRSHSATTEKDNAQKARRQDRCHHRRHRRDWVSYGKTFRERGCLCLYYGPPPERTRRVIFSSFFTLVPRVRDTSRTERERLLPHCGLAAGAQQSNRSVSVSPRSSSTSNAFTSSDTPHRPKDSGHFHFSASTTRWRRAEDSIPESFSDSLKSYAAETREQCNCRFSSQAGSRRSTPRQES